MLLSSRIFIRNFAAIRFNNCGPTENYSKCTTKRVSQVPAAAPAVPQSLS
jgi:hypothetical protein